jgi:transposase-like protein
MAGIPGCAPRRYTHQEKVALVTEIDRIHRDEGGSLRSIARKLGTTETSYLNWRKAGIEPKPESKKQPNRRAYPLEERRRLLSEVERFLDQGKTLADSCRITGISDESFRRWKSETQVPWLRPVEITALMPIAPEPRNSPAETLILITPGGYRLEGLDIENAIKSLRALS